MVNVFRISALVAACAILASATQAADAQSADAKSSVVKPAIDRFASIKGEEVPDFRRHVVPLLGKLGCNGRACHGSFKGQGGFRLSLFGYDFKMDHEGLSERIDTDAAEDSYALQKAMLEEPHKGGKRLDKNSWEYNIFIKWIGGGAKNVDLEKSARFEKLEVTPSEVRFKKTDEKTQLKVVAHWSDGSQEDVTCLCRFQTNDDVIADVSKTGEIVSTGGTGDTHIVVYYDNGVKPIPVLRPVSDRTGKNYPLAKAKTKVDGFVQDKLRKLGVVPSEIAGDTEFLRRLSLDVSGTLPTPKEIADFVADKNKNKRAKKIDQLLSRPAYAAWWATRFSDWTGNNDDALNNVTPVRNRASQDWYKWIEKRMADNTPYDKIVEGFVMATSRDPGESYKEYCENMSATYGKSPTKSFADRNSVPHYWARGNFRTSEDRAIAFAYNFLGIRIQCAQCHKHPFDQWTMDEFHKFKNFFTNTRFRGNPDSKAEALAMTKALKLDPSLRGGQLRNAIGKIASEGKRVVPFEEVWTAKVKPAPVPNKNAKKKKKPQRQRGGAQAKTAKLLGRPEQVDLSKYDDSRQPLMDWLRAKDNRLFARAIVNRIWSCYFNVGIVEPADDMSLANPPSNRALLDYLTNEFVAKKYDLKWLHREILNSSAYQRTWAPNETNRLDERNFSHSIPRRMPAEVAVDAIAAATASDEELAKMHASVDGRSIAIPGAGLRTTGANYALTIFGRSTRESNCDCDRSSEPSLLQTVFMQNDTDIYNQIDRGKGGWLAQVATELGLKQNRKAASNNVQRQITSLERSIERGYEQLKKAKASGDKALEKTTSSRIAKSQVRLKALRKQASGKVDKVAQQTDNAEKLPSVVRRTYLRTLSRQPTDDELENSLAYIKSSENQLDGIRDLLWALVNTKEFIVNH
jgi:hypothetical protein